MNFNMQQNAITNTFCSKTLEGNWYEERCTSNFDKTNNKKIMLENPNSWMYDKTSSELGVKAHDYPKLKEKFSESNDNYINFQAKNNQMFVSNYKSNFDEKYKAEFKPKSNVKDYFEGKTEELNHYRETWTKRGQLFETTYKADIIEKTGKIAKK